MRQGLFVANCEPRAAPPRSRALSAFIETLKGKAAREDVAAQGKVFSTTYGSGSEPRYEPPSSGGTFLSPLSESKPGLFERMKPDGDGWISPPISAPSLRALATLAEVSEGVALALVGGRDARRAFRRTPTSFSRCSQPVEETRMKYGASAVTGHAWNAIGRFRASGVRASRSRGGRREGIDPVHIPTSQTERFLYRVEQATRMPREWGAPASPSPSFKHIVNRHSGPGAIR